MKYTQMIAGLLLVCVLLIAGCTAPGETQPATQAKDWESILAYSEYLEMTKEEQDAFYKSFEDPVEFFAWFDAVKAIYDEQREENHYDGGSIDIGGMSGDTQGEGE